MVCEKCVVCELWETRNIYGFRYGGRTGRVLHEVVGDVEGAVTVAAVLEVNELGTALDADAANENHLILNHGENLSKTRTSGFDLENRTPKGLEKT